MREQGLKLTAVAAFVSIACHAATQPPQTVLKSKFHLADVAWANGEGSNRLDGNAFIRMRIGGVQTCAGYEVKLIPVSVYAKEVMIHRYGNAHKGFNPLGEDGRHTAFANLDQAYVASRRTTLCDSEGRFTFDRLPDGEYYVVTRVAWDLTGFPLDQAGASREPQGGDMMQRVRVSGGQAVSLVMAY